MDKNLTKDKHTSPVDARVMPELIPVEKRQDTLVKVNGVSFRCKCDANVFKIVEKNPDVFRCNACGKRYRDEGNHIPGIGNMVEIVDEFRMLVSQMEEAIRAEGDFPHPWTLDDLIAEYRYKYEHHFVDANKKV